MDYAESKPSQVRELIRNGIIDGPTTGMCNGYAHGNLVILPEELSWDFLLFCQRNPRACPLLEVSDAGSRSFPQTAKGSDITKDVPRYRIYENGICTGESTDISLRFEEYQNTKGRLISFLIGCSFSFEDALLEAGVPVRHIEENRNVPMYNTNIPLTPAGVFHGNMVVSMRPVPRDLVVRAVTVTAAMPRVHGAPIHVGDPAAIGIGDLGKPDYGESVTIHEGEVPVFWPCGVTPQAVVMRVKPAFAITHAPGHMLITDIKNAHLKD